MKLLFSEASRAFVTWLKKDAQFVQLVATELEDETIYSDILCEVRMHSKRALLHIEFQKKRDSNMQGFFKVPSYRCNTPSKRERGC
jgi:hypothetical protein